MLRVDIAFSGALAAIHLLFRVLRLLLSKPSRPCFDLASQTSGIFDAHKFGSVLRAKMGIRASYSRVREVTA